jgi:shikimate kinase
MTERSHLALVGLMGSGKTTVGERCAKRLGRDFVDTDDVVTGLAGMPVAEIFSTMGEPRFRELERQAVASVCASPVPLVVACGGGVAVDPANRRQLSAAAFVVWLRAPVDVLAARCGDGESRPLLAGDARASLTRLLALRTPAYEAVADAAVDTEGRDVDDVVAAVLDAYTRATP